MMILQRLVLLVACSMMRAALALVVSTATAAKVPTFALSPVRPSLEQGPHFLTSTDNFLRSSSRRVGQAAASILGVQGSLDDMRQDLSGEYALWQEKKKALAAEKGSLQKELTQLQAQLLEQRLLGEEKVRLQGELALQKAETKKATQASFDVQLRWAPQRDGMQKDIALLEAQIASLQAQKIQKLNTVHNKTSQIQATNRALQSQIFLLNQQVAALERELSNRTIVSKQVHSQLLSEVAVLQKQIHALQDEVVARAQLQLEVQRRWKRLSAQASEVVEQKEQLQKVRQTCEQELKALDGKIGTAQAALKASSMEMAQCQRADAEAQSLQGSLNECQAMRRR